MGCRAQLHGRLVPEVMMNLHPKATPRILALPCHSPASHLNTLFILISICLAVVIVVNRYNWFSY